jgi:hypothetical protein
MMTMNVQHIDGGLHVSMASLERAAVVGFPPNEKKVRRETAR